MSRLTNILLTLTGLFLMQACDTSKKAGKLRFISPEAGTVVQQGKPLVLKLEIPGDRAGIDSVVYAVDGTVFSSTAYADSVSLDTHKLTPGQKTLSAHVYRQGTENTAYSNIVLVPQPPRYYSFKVIYEYPHDPEAFTQGLEYHEGVLYESTGQRGRSSLRRTELKTGKILKKISLGSQYFGEGMTIVGKRIIQLTWQENIGFIYDLQSMEATGQFSYGRYKEGWGLCYDGEQHLILSDGTNQLYFLNKDTYQEERSLKVYNHKGPVDSLNELEFIKGKIYANVYGQDIIVIIDPATGAIEGEINLIGIYPDKDKIRYDNELNGIAYDRTGDRLFVTGKNWAKLFEIEMVAR